MQRTTVSEQYHGRRRDKMVQLLLFNTTPNLQTPSTRAATAVLFNTTRNSGPPMEAGGIMASTAPHRA
jgi:hypothetical protein